MILDITLLLFFRHTLQDELVKSFLEDFQLIFTNDVLNLNVQN